MKQMGMLAFLCLAASMVGASGCGSSASGCDMTVSKVHVCQTVTSGDTTGWDAACTQAGGQLATCPSGLGVCTMTQGVWTLEVTYYDDSGLTVDQAKTACTGSSGTWK